jgi:hypothetical protein
MPITNHFSLVFRLFVGAVFSAWIVAMVAQPPSLYPIADQMGVAGHLLSGGLGFLVIMLSAKSTHHSLDKALSSGFFMLLLAAVVAFFCVKMWGSFVEKAEVHLNPSSVATQPSR